MVWGSAGDTVIKINGEKGQRCADLCAPQPPFAPCLNLLLSTRLCPVFQQDYGSLLGTEIGCSSSLFTSQAGQMQGRWTKEKKSREIKSAITGAHVQRCSKSIEREKEKEKLWSD